MIGLIYVPAPPLWGQAELPRVPSPAGDEGSSCEGKRARRGPEPRERRSLGGVLF